MGLKTSATGELKHVYIENVDNDGCLATGEGTTENILKFQEGMEPEIAKKKKKQKNVKVEW